MPLYTSPHVENDHEDDYETLTPLQNGLAYPSSSSSAEQPSTPASMNADEQDDYLTTGTSKCVESRPECRKLSHVQNQNLTFPRSQYEGWIPPLPIVREFDALDDLINEYKKSNTEIQDDYIPIELCEFTIYRPKTSYVKGRLDFKQKHDLEMEPLNLLCVQNGSNEFLFDGILSYGTKRHFVQGVRFSTRSIEGYCDTNVHSVSDIWIQTPKAGIRNVFYRLTSPSTEYYEYHHAFCWVANLAKHFVDYMDENDQITLEHFRVEFNTWIMSRHGHDADFQRWAIAYGRTDFRIVVNAYADYLFNEAVDVNSSFEKEFIWREILSERLSAIPSHIDPAAPDRTVTTPFAYKCFEKCYFKDYIKSFEPSPNILKAKQKCARERGFAHDSGIYATEPPAVKSLCDKIRPGDVVGTHSDGGSSWKRTTAMWFAYVQDVRVHRGERVLSVIWLYQPRDILEHVHYPIANELFFSTDCNCGQDIFRASEVLCKIDVDWFAHNVQSKNYIVRQKFDTDEEQFTTLKRSDFTCGCKKQRSRPYDLAKLEYKIGDTVLLTKEDFLRPAIITTFIDSKRRVLVQLLQPRQEGENVKPNELVAFGPVTEVSANLIKRRCHVQAVTSAQIRSNMVPTPYDRDGCGDCFYIASDDPAHPMPPFNPGIEPWSGSGLPGMSLFCGGGSFDRGLEEGGAVETRVAIDMDNAALHTYKANLAFEDQIQLYLGSVCTYLKAALAGDSSYFAKPGDICFLCGGSPCVAFSTAQQDKQSPRSLKNASLVASVLSYIDLYRHRYGVLENVVPMAHSIKGNEGSNIFAQLYFSLVALGYQVKCYILDAWSCGNCQSRSRLFITFASPGLALPKMPNLTHTHPAKTPMSKLGKYATGQPFCERRAEPTPFKFITIRKATQHLPNIGNARIGICVPYPDHRIVKHYNVAYRAQMDLIPVMPREQSFAKALANGLVPEPQLDNHTRYNKNRTSSNSKAWLRCHPEKVFPTVTTVMNPENAFGGASLHFEQHRPLTVEESKIAQGIPNDEIIIGRPSAQRKIAGNGVSRAVALAIGLTFRAAYKANGPDFPRSLPLPVDQTSKIVVLHSESIRHSSTIHADKQSRTVDDEVEISTKTVLHRSTTLPRATQEDEYLAEESYENQREYHRSSIIPTSNFAESLKAFELPARTKTHFETLVESRFSTKKAITVISSDSSEEAMAQRKTFSHVDVSRGMKRPH